jgi:hypothetical protein
MVISQYPSHGRWEFSNDNDTGYFLLREWLPRLILTRRDAESRGGHIAETKAFQIDLWLARNGFFALFQNYRENQKALCVLQYYGGILV